ncbi:hypothetical protein Y1Q_0003601 [Alligator mississippiensis]|uniref:Uncharacterized protein n=1 Tax=Alligator mississippiensis TaxID=8496 RepID=A0A151PG63_ALLMI|nr:hypothetical protein Y1Q_0003601 [Alligator mississippiensis]
MCAQLVLFSQSCSSDPSTLSTAREATFLRGLLVGVALCVRALCQGVHCSKRKATRLTCVIFIECHVKLEILVLIFRGLTALEPAYLKDHVRLSVVKTSFS